MKWTWKKTKSHFLIKLFFKCCCICCICLGVFRRQASEVFLRNQFFLHPWNKLNKEYHNCLFQHRDFTACRIVCGIVDEAIAAYKLSGNMQYSFLVYILPVWGVWASTQPARQLNKTCILSNLHKYIQIQWTRNRKTQQSTWFYNFLQQNAHYILRAFHGVLIP